MSLTAHKVYGPKGIGALYVRSPLRIAPQQIGGGQERGLRAGTLPTTQIVGMGAAIDLADREQPSASERIRGLRNHLWQQLQQLPGIRLNGDLQQRLPDNLNVSFAGIQTNALLHELQPTVALSAGSACSSGKPSHVLAAIGCPADSASLRFSLGRSTTAAEIEQVATAVVKAVNFLRSARETEIGRTQGIIERRSSDIY
jgi:cysteine desulfurase